MKKNLRWFLITQYKLNFGVISSGTCVRKDLMFHKRWRKMSLKNPGKALEIGANVGTALASRSTKAVSSSLLEVINFFHTAKRLYLGKFV